MSYYAVLELSTQASPEDIRRAYRRLVLSTHPDRTPDPAQHRRYLAINEAYETLSDPARRAAYDAALARAHHRPTAPAVSPEASRRPPPVEFRRGQWRTILKTQRFDYGPYVAPARRWCQLLLVLPLLVLLDFYGPRRTVTATFDAIAVQRSPDTMLRYSISTSNGSFVTPLEVPNDVPAFQLRVSWLFRFVHEARLPDGRMLPLEPEMGSMVFFVGLLALLAATAQWPQLSAGAVVNLSIVASVVGLIALLLALTT
ncbi:J domain-containing protein [Hymenobacter yonginensis]|uniref:J domain-containing protein n=1 Tax=Hymenobacter yonginensis TaxID=748197 RepID=A0ABY7PK99_9BACT|nr:J domain-containing protein [Hymenobacter yonginensis]WBO83657.1 J domain-containing protein [Hymenobacter yonginensis]